MKNMDALTYAKLGANTIMKKFKPAELPPNHRFHYHQGVFLVGVERIYQITKDETYRCYIKEWVDFNIDEDGDAPNCVMTEFDDIQPAILLFDLYHTTKDERYKKVLDRLYDKIEKWPTNAKGGIWHKYQNKNQMWLDSMYMMGVITSMYAYEFGEEYLFEKVYTQMKLMKDNMTNPETGLMYHMWDDSKKEKHVDPKTGLVKVSWGRAIGWFAVAVAEILEYLPKNHHLRQEFIKAEQDILNALKQYQDKKTGLWYQVVDKADDERNWLETSCSALFTYAMAKSLRLGIIDESFQDSMMKGYHGVLSKTKVQDETLTVTGVCIGTGVGEPEYYYERDTVENDLHGMGAFLLMCTEIYKLENHI
jgi:unsaturated rhamnogalacturonyl hydrolase